MKEIIISFSKKHPIWSIILVSIFINLFFISIINYNSNDSQGLTSKVISKFAVEEVNDDSNISQNNTEQIILEETIEEYANVTRIIDGDTIELESGKRVRLICMDTPEMGEKYYSQAAKYLSNLILNKEVLLKKDVSEYDKYGRLVRYIYIDDIFVNEEMVNSGWAVAYPYFPDTQLCPEIEKAEKLAKKNELGIWSKEDIIIEESDDESKDNSKESILEVCDCSGNLYNCPDFTNQGEAQECFIYCGEDVHALDRDKDGVACESLKR